MDEYEKRLNKRLRENLCLKTNVVNIKKAQSREEELFGLGEYLPNLLRSFLSPNYYTKMREMGVIDKVLGGMAETRKQGREKDIYEFVEWVEKHQDFEDLLNRKKFEELDKELKALDEFWNKMDK